MEEKVKELLEKLNAKIEKAEKETKQLAYRCGSDKFWYEFSDKQKGYLQGLLDARKLIEQYLN